MNGLTILGILTVYLASVYLAPGQYEDVRMGFSGLNKIQQVHGLDVVQFTQCDNYILDSKNEEEPRYTTLSVRPGETPYLNAPGGAIRGLWEYSTPSGDTSFVMANSSGLYKARASTWTTLEAGLSDNPWEGYQYRDPVVSRLYLCNGIDRNRKYLSTGSYKMQNQADATTITGGMTFYYGLAYATADASAVASLEAGEYITWSATAAATDWVEITSIEGNTVKLSSNFPQATVVSTAVQRSNPVSISRHITEYDGHIVLGFINQPSLVVDSNLASGTNFYSLYSAFGVAQSWEATASYTLSGIRFNIWRGSGTTGNVLFKLKTTLTGTTLATVAYPVSALPTASQAVDINFGSVPITLGSHYQTVIERENAATSPVYILRGGAYANGQAAWTHNSTGFDSNWASGTTTIEIKPDDTALTYQYDTGIRSAFVDQTKYGGLISNYAYEQNKMFIQFRDMKYVNIHPDYSIFTKAQLQLYADPSLFGGATIEVSRLLPDNSFPACSWNFRGIGVWNSAGASTAGGDYDNTTSKFLTVEATGYATIDVLSYVQQWTETPAATWNNYGLILKTATYPRYVSVYTSRQYATNPERVPTWKLTTKTGSVEPAEDIFFQTLSNNWNGSKIIYSKRFLPENFPTDNTLQVPGQVCGLGVTGGYLVVGSRSPDALHYYRFTGDVTDGLGIDYVTSMNGFTFGSSKSIAQLPKGAGIMFYSGSAVYLANGQNIELASGNIREEAKKFANYRDPSEYYAGGANAMPQGIVLPSKDTYLLAVPLALGYNSYVYAYNYANGTWTRWTGIYPTALLTRKLSGQEDQLYYGYNTGQVYTQNQSGSTTVEAVAEFYLTGKDLTKRKQLQLLELWGRADNPLTSSKVTMEVTDTVNLSTSKITISPENNTTTDKMYQLNYQPGFFGREIKVRLTQKATEGAISWRTMRLKYSVTN